MRWTNYLMAVVVMAAWSGVAVGVPVTNVETFDTGTGGWGSCCGGSVVHVPNGGVGNTGYATFDRNSAVIAEAPSSFEGDYSTLYSDLPILTVSLDLQNFTPSNAIDIASAGVNFREGFGATDGNVDVPFLAPGGGNVSFPLGQWTHAEFTIDMRWTNAEAQAAVGANVFTGEFSDIFRNVNALRVAFNCATPGCAPPNNVVGMDNFTMTFSPEPGSLALLSLGGLVALRRRRTA